MLGLFHKLELADKLKKVRECGSCCNLLSRERTLVSDMREKYKN